ncbi:hypothetical protein J1N35_014538 [Gossypium stocksii]|uniref:Uncharacterized protein n=1 Tax=Gossypium stocksii TaxID=47602 RepID=A0A9D3VV52_9ROSI|nr:hypothetical protein J1N35_014538 [Gossypium stocksii]
MHDYNVSLLRVPTILLAKKFSSQGDKPKWYPPKEGGDFVWFMNKRVCDLERFFASKWPDLRRNHFQKGVKDAIPVTPCFDAFRRHRN